MILSGIRLSRGMHLIQQSAHAVAHADGASSWKPKSARRQSLCQIISLMNPRNADTTGNTTRAPSRFCT